jgi:hypothetical protein
LIIIYDKKVKVTRDRPPGAIQNKWRIVPGIDDINDVKITIEEEMKCNIKEESSTYSTGKEGETFKKKYKMKFPGTYALLNGDTINDSMKVVSDQKKMKGHSFVFLESL